MLINFQSTCKLLPSLIQILIKTLLVGLLRRVQLQKTRHPLNPLVQIRNNLLPITLHPSYSLDLSNELIKVFHNEGVITTLMQRHDKSMFDGTE